MFDLKAKLLQAGLVTKEQVDKVEQGKREKDKHKEWKGNASSEKPISEKDFIEVQREKQLSDLKKAKKPEQYGIIRRWVLKNRLDKPTTVSLDNEKFFFETNEKNITWLSLNKETIDKIANSEAGVIAFMSDHGLQHAVVPRDIAEDIGAVFPQWLRVLHSVKEKPSDVS